MKFPDECGYGFGPFRVVVPVAGVLIGARLKFTAGQPRHYIGNRQVSRALFRVAGAVYLAIARPAVRYFPLADGAAAEKSEVT